jgi:hypothetical protein
VSASRRQFTTDKKATILKRCLIDKVTMLDLWDDYGIKPNQIYAWQNILFDNAPAFSHPVAKREAKRFSAQEEAASGDPPTNHRRRARASISRKPPMNTDISTCERRSKEPAPGRLKRTAPEVIAVV